MRLCCLATWQSKRKRNPLFRISLEALRLPCKEYEERKCVCTFPAKYRLTKFLRFPETTALQRCKLFATFEGGWGLSALLRGLTLPISSRTIFYPQAVSRPKTPKLYYIRSSAVKSTAQICRAAVLTSRHPHSCHANGFTLLICPSGLPPDLYKCGGDKRLKAQRWVASSSAMRGCDEGWLRLNCCWIAVWFGESLM